LTSISLCICLTRISYQNQFFYLKKMTQVFYSTGSFVYNPHGEKWPQGNKFYEKGVIFLRRISTREWFFCVKKKWHSPGQRQVDVGILVFIKVFDTVPNKWLLSKLRIYTGRRENCYTNRQLVLCNGVQEEQSHIWSTGTHPRNINGAIVVFTSRKWYADCHLPRNNAPMVRRWCYHILNHQKYEMA
jgi:hypothetical protein